MQKDLPQKLLRELLKNSKRSDRDLAIILKVSQPTITRARHKLEKGGMIKDYSIIPDFKKMGFEIMAITLVKLHPEMISPKAEREAKKYAEKFPTAILSSLGEGLGMNGICISLHKNYTDYHRHLNQMRIDWKDFLEDTVSFIVAIGEGEFKRFSLSHLKDVPL